MTVQMAVAHSSKFIGAGVVAGGPYRAAETFPRAAPTAPMSCILNSLYIAMMPLTEATAPDVGKLLSLVRSTPNIDDLANVAKMRLYILTGQCDAVVNQLAVRRTRQFFEGLGVTGEALRFVDDVPAGHSIITSNPEDSPLATNQPPYINFGGFMQSHEILRHIYADLDDPVRASGELMRFDQSEFYGAAQSQASMSPFGYAYVPTAVAGGKEARGVHIVMHGCKQGYDYVNFVGGMPDRQNQPPYGARYMTTTGYMEIAEANDLLLLFPQVGGDDTNAVQNPDGCWDWWGYTASDIANPDYYTKDAVQIRAIAGMLDRLAGA